MLDVDERRVSEISTIGMKVRGHTWVSDSADVRVKEERDATKRMNHGKSPVGIDGDGLM